MTNQNNSSDPNITQRNIEMSNVEIEKKKKKLSKIGSFIYVLGWITTIVNLGLYIWILINRNFASSGLLAMDAFNAISTIFSGSIFIILGRRIKKTIDVNIQKYLYAMLCLVTLFMFTFISIGSRFGIIVIFLFGCIMYGLVIVYKLMKVPEFVSSLSKPNYLLNKKGWIIYITGTIVLLALVASFITIGI